MATSVIFTAKIRSCAVDAISFIGLQTLALIFRKTNCIQITRGRTDRLDFDCCLAAFAYPSLLTKTAAVTVQAFITLAVDRTITRCAVWPKVIGETELTAFACKSCMTFTHACAALSIITVSMLSTRRLQTTRTHLAVSSEVVFTALCVPRQFCAYPVTTQKISVGPVSVTVRVHTIVIGHSVWSVRLSAYASSVHVC